MVLCETAVQLDTNTMYRPDVAFWDSEHWAAVNPRKSPVEIIPQLVVEVKSPSNSIPELFGKAGYYIRSSVNTVWVVVEDPYAVHIFEAGGGRRIVGAAEKLEAITLLPGFSVEAPQFLPPGRA